MNERKSELVEDVEKVECVTPKGLPRICSLKDVDGFEESFKEVDNVHLENVGVEGQEINELGNQSDFEDPQNCIVETEKESGRKSILCGNNAVGGYSG